MRTHPFLPEDRFAPPRTAGADHLIRSAFVIAQAKAFGARDYAERAAELYPGDKHTLAVVQRATTSPGSTTTPGWGQEYVHTVVGNFLASLQTTSAAATLMANGVRMNVVGGSVNIPMRA